ncbi:hypothetical protein BC936DRAFT_137637 [Jimgerdemannia flammicorona]|uniref:Uncharacterized protein n=1 Tax=Jimgerdemannia flammicorona TaxID=994334 RepID=A0A433CWX7_9FUNG|nr:hypothetical protein BC936DRAFT_137637 [Jimgerdemannia flammicorona]
MIIIGNSSSIEVTIHIEVDDGMVGLIQFIGLGRSKVKSSEKSPEKGRGKAKVSEKSPEKHHSKVKFTKKSSEKYRGKVKSSEKSPKKVLKKLQEMESRMETVKTRMDLVQNYFLNMDDLISISGGPEGLGSLLEIIEE